METVIIAVASAKGGVGKTTVTYGLMGAALARGWRVAVLDMDPMCSLTNALFGGSSATARRHSIADVLFQGVPVSEALIAHPLGASVDAGCLNVLAGSRELDGMTVSGGALERLLGAIAGQVDVVLMDTPPACASLQSAMSVAGSIVIPVDLSDQSVYVSGVTAGLAIELGLEDRLRGLLLNRVASGAVVTEIRGRRVRTHYARNLVDALDGMELTMDQSLSDRTAWQTMMSRCSLPTGPELAAASAVLDEIMAGGSRPTASWEALADTEALIFSEDDDGMPFVMGVGAGAAIGATI